MIRVRNHIAQRTKRRLVLLLALLTATFLIVLFKVGESLWPIWLIAHRTQILGFLVFVTLVIFFSSPLIIEANSNPRPLSGPGKTLSGAIGIRFRMKVQFSLAGLFWLAYAWQIEFIFTGNLLPTCLGWSKSPFGDC